MIAGAAAADPGGVGEDERRGRCRWRPGGRHQAGHAVAFLELAADQVAGALRRDHADVDAGRRLDLAEVDREAVGEEQQVAGGDAVGDLLAPDLGLLLVGQQDHHDVAAAGGFGDVEDLEPGRFGLGAAGGVGAQADDHVDAGVLEVEGVGVPLGAVAEDRDGLAVEHARGRRPCRRRCRRFAWPGRLPERRSSAQRSPHQLARRRARQRRGQLDPLRDFEAGERLAAEAAQLVGGDLGAVASTTTAVTACCHSGSSRPTTAASATAGWRSSTSSTSAGTTFSPPLTIRSSIRSST